MSYPEVWDRGESPCPYCFGGTVTIEQRRPPFIVENGMVIGRVKHSDPVCWEWENRNEREWGGAQRREQ